MLESPKLAAAVLLGALSLVLFVNLRDAPIGRASEKRCVNVVRGMLESGDWLVPKLGGTVRLQKPPLFYWSGAVTATLLGDTSPAAVRLVSALATLGLVAMVMIWARTLGGDGAALASGAALAAMLQLTASGRRGDAEMLLALLCVGALFCFDRLYATRRRALLPLFGVLAGLAILTKATAVILVVALPILVFLALERELARLRDPGVLGACALALAIGLSWYAVVLVVVPGAAETLWNDFLVPLGAADAGTDSAHKRPLTWYLAVLPVRAAPASLLLPFVIWRLWTTRLYRGDPRHRFAALTFLVPLVAFSLLPQKQKHYTLSMLPGLALITAETACALAPRARAWLARGLGAPLALVGVASLVPIALYFVWIEARPPIVVSAGALALVGLFGIALVAALRGNLAAFACAWIPAFLLAVTLSRGVIDVRAEEIRATGLRGLTLDEQERVVRVARESPWLFELLQLGDRAGGSD
jgi:4-amino-4-deoxy-L-arabinose transferase-like glycosyltransferase